MEKLEEWVPSLHDDTHHHAGDRHWRHPLSSNVDNTIMHHRVAHTSFFIMAEILQYAKYKTCAPSSRGVWDFVHVLAVWWFLADLLQSVVVFFLCCE